MSGGAKAAVVAAAIGAAVAVFLVLSPTGEEVEPGPVQLAPSTITDPADGPGENKKPEQPKPPPEPAAATIVVKGGAPVGGIQELSFGAGENIRFVVESDVAAEVHLHGYDVAQDVPAGGKTEFHVPAAIEGVFEVELEETHTHIAEITVEP